MHAIESPDDRKPHRFTTDEAAQFLASWWRVTDVTGATVAYVPDGATARAVRAYLNDSQARHAAALRADLENVTMDELEAAERIYDREVSR